MTEAEKIKFEKLIAEKRHKELKKSLERIAVSLEKKEDNGLKGTVEKLTSAIESFVSIKSNSDSEAAIASNEKMAERIIKELKELKNEIQVMSQPREIVMEFTRSDYSQLIQSPVKFITNFKKIKAQA